MMKLKHEFVKSIPDNIDEEVIYISMEYATAIHKCCCGCGKEVVTPFSPTDWRISFDGKSISLNPSIGNWSFPCQSHYWIRNSEIVWARQWTKQQISDNRKADQEKKQEQYKKQTRPSIFQRIFRKLKG